VISRSIVNLIIFRGGAYRPLLHDRHFRAVSSFQIGVWRGRRIASRGMLARVLQRWHSTSSQAYPPLRHCPMVGDGCAGPPLPSIWIDHASASARSASRVASAARRALRAYLRANDLATVDHPPGFSAHGR
jgi:hypothetical protein